MLAKSQANGLPLALFLHSVVLPCGRPARGAVDSLREQAGVITILPLWRGQAAPAAFFLFQVTSGRAFRCYSQIHLPPILLSSL